jgi:hypothetical protein
MPARRVEKPWNGRPDHEDNMKKSLFHPAIPSRQSGSQGARDSGKSFSLPSGIVRVLPEYLRSTSSRDATSCRIRSISFNSREKVGYSDLYAIIRRCSPPVSRAQASIVHLHRSPGSVSSWASRNDEMSTMYSPVPALREILRRMRSPAGACRNARYPRLRVPQCRTLGRTRQRLAGRPASGNRRVHRHIGIHG